MAVLSSKLILSLVDRVTAPARGISQTMARLSDKQRVNAKRMREMRGSMLGAVAGAYALKEAISAPIRAAVDFESAMADVRKVVDFETPAHFKQMGRDVVALSARLPMAANGIAEIAAAAGQSGMRGDEILQFAEMAAKVGIAFDMSAGQTGEALAKIKTSLQLSVADTQTLADAINHLSNTSASSAQDLINYMRRTAAFGTQYGFTGEQTAAIGSAMIAAGAQADVAATSFRNVGKALTRGASATQRQRKAFKRLGIDSGKVAKAMQKDATGTLRNVLSLVKKLPKHLQASTLSDLFGDEARALAPLVNNLELYDKALSSVVERANFLGSSTKEYEQRAKTTANEMQLFKNKVTALSIAIGEALLPAINAVMDNLGPYLKTITDLVRKHPGLTKALVMAASGLVAVSIAASVAKFAFFGLKGMLLGSVIFSLRTVGVVASASGASLRAFAFLALFPVRILVLTLTRARAAMIAFAAAARITGVWSAFGTGVASAGLGLLGLLNPLRLVTSAIRLLKIAVVGTGIGAILVAIATAGTFIYQNWSGIKEMFTGFGSAFMTAIRPIMPVLEPVLKLTGKLKEKWGTFMEAITIGNGSWRRFGEAAGKAIGDIVVWFAELPSRIIDAVGSINLSDWIKWPSPPAWLSEFFGANKNVSLSGPNAPLAGARAAGGAIAGGKTYLVGEYGPELITATRSGYVHNAADTAAMLKAHAGLVSIAFGDVVINNPTDVDEIARELKSRVSDALSGVMADVEWAGVT